MASETTTNELRPDPTPILTLPPDDEKEVELSDEERMIKLQKEKAQMCKVIALHKLGLHPVTTNVSSLKKAIKSQLLELVQELFLREDDDIRQAFNTVVCDVILVENEDYTKYAVYKTPK